MSKKNSLCKLCALMLCSILVVSAVVMTVHYVSYASWVEDDEGKHYKDKKGNFVTGFQIIDDATYFFDDDGRLLTGKIYVQDKDAFYYADSDGVIMVGAIEDGDTFYMTNDVGVLLTGFVEYNGNRYYFDSNVNRVTGWFKVEDSWYYANEAGILQRGFITLEGYRYYLNPDGSRASDMIAEIDGVTYIFNKDGSVDENATALYPLLVHINEIRNDAGLDEFLVNEKISACAIARAAQLVDGYIADEKDNIETQLANRGVSCNGGYEFAYGGIPEYGIDSLMEDMKKDPYMYGIIKDQSVVDVGLGIYVQDDITYYDIIFVK